MRYWYLFSGMAGKATVAIFVKCSLWPIAINKVIPSFIVVVNCQLHAVEAINALIVDVEPSSQLYVRWLRLTAIKKNTMVKTWVRLPPWLIDCTTILTVQLPYPNND